MLNPESSPRKILSDVGIFWDLRAISDSVEYPHKDLNFSVQLGLELVDLARTLNKNSDMDILMKTFCPISVLSTRDNNVLGELGFEVINASSTDQIVYPDIGAHVLMWLWDRCYSTVLQAHPTVIFVSSDTKYLNLLQMLKARGVFVVLFSELLQTELRSTCIQVSNLVVDTNIDNPDVTDNMKAMERPSLDTLYLRNEQQQQQQQARMMYASTGRLPTHDSNSPVSIPVPIPTPSSGYDSRGGASAATRSPPMGYRSPTIGYRSPPPQPDHRNSNHTDEYQKHPPVYPFPMPFPNLRSGTGPGPAPGAAASTGAEIRPQREVLRSEFSFRNDPKESGDVQDEFMSFRESPTDPSMLSNFYDDISSDTFLQQGGLEELTFEQQNMQEQLGICFRQKNIQMTVSTLRKIYTKQSRVFRIPTILAAVMPASGPHPDSNQSFSECSTPNTIFTLNCIQWSIGAQKNANSDSFKYKMNKKISSWLLKEQVKKGVPAHFVPELGNVAIIVTQSILKQVMELELCQEVLEVARVPSPIEVLLPYVYSWVRSPDPVLSGKARDFADQRGIAYNGAPSVNSQLSSRDVVSSHGLSHVAPAYMAQAHAQAQGNTSLSTPQISRPQPQHQPQSHPQIQGQGQGHGRPLSWSVAELDGTDTSQELLFLLRKYPEGILSSHLPMMYLDEFKKPLRVHGKSLNDIMLGLGAEMVSGGSHSGDIMYIFSELSPF